MKINYEGEQGMTSIYRKLRKECRSFNVRRHVMILILAVAMMLPAVVYAEYTGEILSEKRAGQAFEAGWDDGTRNFTGQILKFEGHGVVKVVLVAFGGVTEKTVHGSARLTVDTVGERVELEDCDPAFSSCTSIFVEQGDLRECDLLTVDLKGAFQQTNPPADGTQRGTLTLKITAPGVPCP